MDMLRKNIRPRDIMTKDAIMNALTVDMALGCSTNSMLHLPAIAHECGIEINLDIANRISEKTPNLCHLAPAGSTYIEELERSRRRVRCDERAEQEGSAAHGLHNRDRQDRRREHQELREPESTTLSVPSRIRTVETGGIAVLKRQSCAGWQRCKALRRAAGNAGA